MQFVKLDYPDLVVIRDLMLDINESEEPLNEYERSALDKVEKIVDLMSRKRRMEEDQAKFGYDFNAGTKRDPRFSRFSRGRELSEKASVNQR
jgi:hypothetical protein